MQHKRYINVAYKDREMAKRLGARWDPSVKRWYCPPGSALAKVYSWRKAGSASATNSTFGSAPAAKSAAPALPPAEPVRPSGSGDQLSLLN